MHTTYIREQLTLRQLFIKCFDDVTYCSTSTADPADLTVVDWLLLWWWVGSLRLPATKVHRGLLLLADVLFNHMLLLWSNGGGCLLRLPLLLLLLLKVGVGR